MLVWARGCACMWGCYLGMCNGVGECIYWGADPRALLCSDLFGHVSMTAWGAECSAVLAVVGHVSVVLSMLPCCALMQELCLNPKLLIGQASQWWGHWCSSCLSRCLGSPLLCFAKAFWITRLCSNQDCGHA